jgi:pimeloyl-ACP methyl ester carboxylesterase
MIFSRKLTLILAATGILFTPSSSRATVQAGAEIPSFTAKIDGVRLHYMKAGNGTPLILLHGYAETSRMWRPIIPLLAKRFMVIFHDLAKSLGVQKAEVVGHDIGLMVAYAYAAQFPAEVAKLVLMDAFLPGVLGWEAIYNDPHTWHFRFNGPAPEALVQGRERIYFDYFWNDFAANKTHSIPETDRRAYAAAYARPRRMRAGWAYFVSFLQAARDFSQLSQTKLTMPVLSIGGDKSLGEALGQQVKLVATNATVIVMKDTGHWILEERPKETAEALQNFL